MRKLKWIVLGLVALVVVGAIASPAPKKKGVTAPSRTSAQAPAATTTAEVVPPPPAASPAPSVAHMLAQLDLNRPVSKADTRPYDRALRRLHGPCQNTPIRLSDNAVTAVRLLKAAGLSESNLSVLRNVRRSIPSGWPRSDCTSLFAAYVTIRKG